jgi:hypothetical protein
VPALVRVRKKLSLKSVLALTTERGSFSGSALGLGSGAFHDCGL